MVQIALAKESVLWKTGLYTFPPVCACSPSAVMPSQRMFRLTMTIQYI